MKLHEGECVSLIGENGAGKSTLIKILCGVYSKDEGEIYLNGQIQNITNAEEGKKLGISVIYQELSLFPDMKVYENIFANTELQKTKKKGSLMPLDISKMRKKAREILHDRLNVDIDVDARIRDIPFSQRQMVEIGRAILADSKIIFMDEPTAALENKEKKTLFRIIKDLKAQNKTIIFISHHLDEIFENCDRTIVLRDGLVVMEEVISDITEKELVQAMIGGNVSNYYPKVMYERGEKILSVKHLTKNKVFQDISFELHKREVLGIIGLAGCGKYEIVRALFGATSYDSGEIMKEGNRIYNRSIRESIHNKFAFIPSERKTESIFPNREVSWNTTISFMEKICGRLGLDLNKEKEITEDYIRDLKIKVTDQKQPISSLSGGNQQKVILARWFLTEPDILILEEPTRGIDVNAKTEVYKLIMDYLARDKSVIMVSSEEEEVLGICDRIMVIHNGEITGILDAKDTDIEQLKTITNFGKAAG
ncbi:MAG: sugar ABC transporter ATP-binding protein [Clostridiales bacterium]|nr:sugar ABC transporter ATP-binding protein [Clostridiales bacterium]